MAKNFCRNTSRSFVAFLAGSIFASSSGTLIFAQQSPAANNPPIAADLFQFPPASPAELVEAARVTQQLDRAMDSRAFLRRLLDLQLSDTELLELRNTLGSSLFIELRQDQTLQPEAALVLQALNGASAAGTLTVPEMLELVQKLATPGYVGANAVGELTAIGELAIPVLLSVDPSSPSARVANEILITRARDLRFGLLKNMEESTPQNRVRILKILGTTADAQLVLHLLRWQFDPQQPAEISEAARKATARLTKSRGEIGTAAEAADFLMAQGEILLKFSSARFSPLEPAAIREVSGRNPQVDALNEATILLRDATIIDPSNTETKTLALVAACAGTDPSLLREATVAANVAQSELVAGLAKALELHPAAAIEILRALATRSAEPASRDELTGVMRKAVLNTDPRVRFLASHLVRTHLDLDVSNSAISQSLISAKKGSLKPEMVIVTADDTQLRTLQHAFQDAGYDAQIAETGPAGFDLSAAQMNCELFVLHAEAPGWPLATTLANLRADIRTRNSPVVVIGPDRFQDRVLALSEIHPGVWFVNEPAGTETILVKLNNKNLPSHVLTPDDRAVMNRMAQ